MTNLVALRLDAVSAGYGNSVTLSRVTVSLQRGESWAICGPNGSGKSTLLRVMSGRLPARVGEVSFFGVPLSGLDRRAIAREMAVVPQDVDVAFDFTVREVVAMGRAPHGATWRAESVDDQRVIDRELERLDLVALADAHVHEISGGERKRVAIARALAQEPRVLLLDEPNASLDVRHEARLFSLLAELAKAGTTVVTVLHDFAAAMRVASHAMLLAEGALLAAGDAREVLARERLAEVFGVELEERISLVAKGS